MHFAPTITYCCRQLAYVLHRKEIWDSHHFLKSLPKETLI
jgi:hypothetical protein